MSLHCSPKPAFCRDFSNPLTFESFNFSWQVRPQTDHVGYNIFAQITALSLKAILRAGLQREVCAGEHEHTIVGYSLVKGIGDGEPIASERFTVGGHEWVRLSPTGALRINSIKQMQNY